MPDLNDLRKVGFSKKQAFALSELGSAGTNLDNLPPFQPAAPGTKVHQFVVGETTGNPDWDGWIGMDANGSETLLGTYTARATQRLVLAGIGYVPGHEGSWETSSGLYLVPADLPSADWEVTGEENANGVGLLPGDTWPLTVQGGRDYHLFAYDNDTAFAGHTVQLDYTDFWNIFGAAMLPPGQVCSVLNIEGQLYLIPNPVTVGPAPRAVREVQLMGNFAFDPAGVDPYRCDMVAGSHPEILSGEAQAGISWDATANRFVTQPRQMWTMSVKLSVASYPGDIPDGKYFGLSVNNSGDVSTFNWDVEPLRSGASGPTFTMFFRSGAYLKIDFVTNWPEAVLHAVATAQVVV